MTLFYLDEELLALMEDFYTLTGIKIVLFDTDYNELIAYPKDTRTFCTLMRENGTFDGRCRACDESACRTAKETGALHVYRCHAGLTEAVAPITENGKIIAFMLFGAVTEKAEKDAFFKDMQAICKAYGETRDLSKYIRRIKSRTGKHILAAARILDSFTGYILRKGLVRLSTEELFERIRAFVEGHLSEELSVPVICAALGVSRTRLYEVMRRYGEDGVASFIKTKRLLRAKELLRATDMKVSEIASAVGFSDYNYFLREFKRYFGVSSKKIRANAN